MSIQTIQLKQATEDEILIFMRDQATEELSEVGQAQFEFPKSHDFPPLYTLQPNPTTRLAQNQKWSRTIQLYCRYHFLFRLSLPNCLDLPLFKNLRIRKRLVESDVREVLTWVASEEGGRRGEWVGKDVFLVYWNSPEEWAELIWRWVNEAGHKGAVLTFYELLQGDATAGQGAFISRNLHSELPFAYRRTAFHEMDADLFAKCMAALAKRGKAQVFGEQDSQGVKFF